MNSLPFRITAMLACLLGAACTPAQPAPSATAPLRVVATTGMIADAARSVGGDACEVIALMGPGVDPHLYKPTQGDLRTLGQAQVILYNGLRLEGRMGEALNRMTRHATVDAVAEVIPADELRASEDYDDHFDPHVWMSVRLWKQVVARVHEVLREAEPVRAATLDANATAYLAELDDLEEWVRATVAELPPPRRILVTAHDAFGYFGEAYGFEVVGLQGISTEAEFGLRDLERLVDLVVEKDIQAVFLETSVSRRSLEALAEGARARGHELVLGGPLYSDALGEAGSPEGTYTGMIRHNVRVIAEALR